jgi:hypothetical protein
MTSSPSATYIFNRPNQFMSNNNNKITPTNVPAGNKAKQYLASQKEKWATYQKTVSQGSNNLIIFYLIL